MDAIIFDVDGTLWDSTQAVADAWSASIRKHSSLDMTLTGEGLKPLFGKTMDEITTLLFPYLPDDERKMLGDLCFEEEPLYLKDHHGILFDGVEETFKALSEKYPLYIVSNCQCGYIEVFLETMGLQKYIKDTLCFGQTGTPKGETIRTLMTNNNLDDVVYVGDTKGDYEACIAADVPFIFASYGFGEVPEANVSISDITDLIKMYC